MKCGREGTIKMKKCQDCKFAIFQDHGYSNYTVEGTTFECGVSAHPDGEFDRFYGDEPKLEYAEKCPHFAAGESIDMDVDRENIETLTEEQRIIFDGKWPKVESVKESKDE